MSHSPSPGDTDCEARNPGPFEAATANITALQTQHVAALRIPAEALGLPELRLTMAAQALWAIKLEKWGWHVVFGAPMPEDGSAMKAKPGGVGILSRHPIQPVPPVDELSDWLWSSTRFVHAAMPFAGGKHVLHLISVYGFTNAATDAGQKRLNEEFLRNVFLYVSALGQVAVLILGDFNTTREASASLDAALSSGQYWDAAEVVAQVREEEPQNTCFVKDTSVGSRIDLVLCNTQAVTMLQDARVEQDAGLPTHKPVIASFDLDLGPQKGLRYRMLCKLPTESQDPDPDADSYQARNRLMLADRARPAAR